MRQPARVTVPQHVLASSAGGATRASRCLCREPWESYYILRRGVMPCCHGAKPIAPMEDWAAAWNSPALQEIRACLAQGRLSAYCLESTGCPIVQRYLARSRTAHPVLLRWLESRPAWARTLNGVLGGVPGLVRGGVVRLVRGSRGR